MKRSRLLLLMPIAAAAWAGGAQACVDAKNMRAVFSYQRPTRSGDMEMLRVRLVPGGSAESGVLHAWLLEGPLHRSRDGFVRIQLPMIVGGDCIQLGPTDGPVFVVGTLWQTAPGQLAVVAQPTQIWPLGAYRRRRDRVEQSQYIVYPADLPVPAPRHKGGQ